MPVTFGRRVPGAQRSCDLLGRQGAVVRGHARDLDILKGLAGRVEHGRLARVALLPTHGDIHVSWVPAFPFLKRHEKFRSFPRSEKSASASPHAPWRA